MKSFSYQLLLLLICLKSGVTAGIPVFETIDIQQLLDSDKSDEQVQWALHYQHGEGVPKDVNQAIKLFCKAARTNNSLAQYQLGLLYMHGRSILKNEQQAAAWLQLAADQGDRYAKKMLHFVSNEKNKMTAQCLLTDGSEYLQPIKSVPNPSPDLIRLWVERLAPEYSLESSLVIEVIRAESNFNPRAMSNKNAHGLMQLIPATAKRFGVTDIWDPIENIRGGMAYLNWLLDHFDGNLELALAGYNAGEHAVEIHKGVPPFKETQQYVRLIQKRLSE